MLNRGIEGILSQESSVMNRSELMAAGCGRCCDTRNTTAWRRKQKFLYGKNGVLDFFKDRRKALRDGGMSPYSANKEAQTETDELLFQRAAGVGNTTPATKEAMLTPEDDDLRDIAEFGEAADWSMDPIRDLTWIYHNIAVKGVEPADAPSPGAYAHLKFVQQNNINKVDFFTKVYPRIIPSKSIIENMSKFNDDNRGITELLDKLQEELLDGEGEVPVL